MLAIQIRIPQRASINILSTSKINPTNTPSHTSQHPALCKIHKLFTTSSFLHIAILNDLGIITTVDCLGNFPLNMAAAWLRNCYIFWLGTARAEFVLAVLWVCLPHREPVCKHDLSQLISFSCPPCWLLELYRHTTKKANFNSWQTFSMCHITAVPSRWSST